MQVVPHEENDMTTFTKTSLTDDLNDLNRQYQAAFRNAEGSDFQLLAQAASAVEVIGVQLNSIRGLISRTASAVVLANDQLDYNPEDKAATSNLLAQLEALRDVLTLAQKMQDRINMSMCELAE